MKQISVDEYIDYTIKNFRRASFPQLGKLYSFAYLLNNFKNSKDIKFHDFYPTALVINIDIKKKTFHAFNINKVAPSERDEWLTVFDRFVGDKLEPKKFIELVVLIKQSQFALRQYSMKDVRQLRLIPKSSWKEIAEIYSNTTHSATTNEITAKYLNYLK